MCRARSDFCMKAISQMPHWCFFSPLWISIWRLIEFRRNCFKQSGHSTLPSLPGERTGEESFLTSVAGTSATFLEGRVVGKFSGVLRLCKILLWRSRLYFFPKKCPQISHPKRRTLRRDVGGERFLMTCGGDCLTGDFVVLFKDFDVWLTACRSLNLAWAFSSMISARNRSAEGSSCRDFSKYSMLFWNSSSL